jgi:hypothetical protein
MTDVQISQQAASEMKAVLKDTVKAIEGINGRNPKATTNRDLTALRKGREVLSKYSDPNDFKLKNK